MKMIAYGMNTNVDNMSTIAPTAKFMGKAKLPKHKLVFKVHADVEPAINDMYCVLWEIDATALKEIDALEGYPTYYERKEVEVLFDGAPLTAWVYYMVDGHDYAMPTDAYYDLLRDGYASAGIGMGQLHLAKAECTLWQNTI